MIRFTLQEHYVLAGFIILPESEHIKLRREWVNLVYDALNGKKEGWLF